jgi:methionyl-tRNA formyltransferase
MRLVFAGTPEFAARALAALIDAGHELRLVLTQPDRRSGRGMQVSESAVKRLASLRGLQVFQPAKLGDSSSLAQIATARPDALVVAAYGLILPQSVLDLAPHGAINIHASLLPRWRGAAPIQRALLAGDRRTGITIMQMDAGLDTGPILAQRALEIAPDEDAGSLHDRLAALGAEMIVAELAAILSGRAQARAQPHEGVTYAHKLGKSETMLDWARPAVELERAVRAFRPSPGAQTRVRGETIKIWRAALVQCRGRPGEVVGAGPNDVVVACGEGGLAIKEIQRAGARRLSVAEVLRGWPIRVGERLGAPES